MACHHSSRWVVPAALFAALFLGACAPEPSATPEPTPEPTVEPTVAAATVDNSAFCASYPPLIQAFMDSPLSGDSEAASQLESSVVMTEAEKLAAVVTASGGLAPDELGPSFGLVSTALDKIRATGDATGFMDEEMMTQTLDVDQWVYDHCGWAQVPVSAVDYAFEDIPATLPAGMTAFRLENAGKQFHVMLIVRRQPGSTTTVDELLAYQGDGMAPGFELVAATGTAPGSFGVAVGELTPGEYLALNPLPKDGAEGGTPLGAEGMMAEFTVE